MDNILDILKILGGIGFCIGFFWLIMSSKSDELFQKAIKGLAIQNAEINSSVIIDLYLGSHEKTRNGLTKKDIYKIEKSLLWILAVLSAEEDESKKANTEALSKLHSMVDEIRQYKLSN